jgi:E3 ubiquitin-protein ligase TRAF7
LKTHGGSIYALATVESKYLLCGTYENSIDVWNCETYDHVRRLEGHMGAVYSLAVCNNTRRFFTGSYDSTLKMWSLDSWTCIQTLVRHTSSVDAIVIYGSFVFSGSADNTIKIWK